MLKGKKIGFIGAGNMAQAIIAGLMEKKVIPAQSVLVADKVARRNCFLKDKYGVKVAEDNRSLVEASHMVVLAVKPQNFSDIVDEIGSIGSDKLIISILAGTRTKTIESGFGGSVRVVRVMPNTPALVGEGMAGIAPGGNATQQDVDITQYIFQQLGKVIVVDEPMLDVVTGVSGSGPAYVFYFIEALRDAAVHMGLDADQAGILATQTFLGSVKLLLHTKEDPAQLRAQVTSRGGTTERGLRVLNSYNIKKIILQTVEAATIRSKELSDNG